VGGGRWYLRGPNDLNREQTARVHTERERKSERITRKKKGREEDIGNGQGEEGWRAREKGGNGARYGEMARKPGIVTGNGRRSPLTERKLESEEIVGGQPLPAWSLHKPYHSGTYYGRRTKEETNWDTLRTRIAEGTKGDPMRETMWTRRKRSSVSLSDWSLSLLFFPFLRYLNCARKPFAGLNWLRRPADGLRNSYREGQ